MTKEIKVSGRIPMSVRKQLKKTQAGTRKTIKHKRIKKIKLPDTIHDNSSTTQSTPVTLPSSTAPATQNPTRVGHNDKQKELKSAMRTTNKTFKKVRFNLESEGIQHGKFKNAQRVRLKNQTQKADRDHTPPIHTKNRTSKNKGFKIRYTEPDPDMEIEVEEIPDDKLDLIQNLTEVRKQLEEDVIIRRV